MKCKQLLEQCQKLFVLRGPACDVQMRQGAVCDDGIDIFTFELQLAKA